VTVFEAGPRDIFAWVSVDHTPGFERTTFGRASSFYRDQQFLLQGTALQAIAKPEDAKLAFWREYLLLELRSDWTVAGRTWPRGALLVTPAAAFLKGERQFTALFTPSATRSLEDYTATRSRLVLNVLDNVASRLEEWYLADGRVVPGRWPLAAPQRGCPPPWPAVGARPARPAAARGPAGRGPAQCGRLPAARFIAAGPHRR